ncbi:hypothetical protein QFC22_004405 [Naganishia vaughanmartiniae]|uniref:Uncharacterized protein n=1 Tax=Naganishia vaughanmartiniae TaxID=1424756 RepID=A0ACC2X2D7_9TREE|nr:hypothetical protein QFC22_004405 [Naganishia vaughanmartiniae]
MPPINNITILGGGLTGLTIAYRLSRLIPTLPALIQSPDHAAVAHRDTTITLIEKSPRIGGWVNSTNVVVKVPKSGHKGKGKEQAGDAGETMDVEITLEAGPRSIRPKGSAGAAYMLKLIQDLSLDSAILSVPHSHPSAQNRFILSRATNRLVRLPSGLKDVLGFPPAGGKVISQQGVEQPGTDAAEEKRLRKLLRRGIFGDLLKSRSPSPPMMKTCGYRDTTVHQLVSNTLGPTIANSLISSMVHGIYAADSRKLSVRSTFPILWDSMYPSSTSASSIKRTGSLVWNLLSSSLFGGKKAPQTTEQQRRGKEEADAWRKLGQMDGERKKWSVYGLKGGLGVLTDRMREEVERSKVQVKTDCVVDDIKVDSQGLVQLHIHPSSNDASGVTKQHETSLLISTLNPSTLHPLLTPAQRLPHLTANPSTTVGLVNIVYPLPSSAIHPDGFGYLVPRAPEDDGLPPAFAGTPSKPNPSGVLGVVFDSTTLPVDPTPDAAQHVTKLTIMLGGPHWRAEDDIPKNTEILVAQAQEHLKSVFPVLRGVEPVLIRGWIHRDCIPTYLPGHGARLRELYQILSGESSAAAGPSSATEASAWAGKLVLAGSGYGGVGVNDCVGAAEGIVRALEKKWTRDQHDPAHEEEGEVPVTGLERWRSWD